MMLPIDQRAQNLEPVELREPHADSGGGQGDDDNQQHLLGGNAFAPFDTKLFHTPYLNTPLATHAKHRVPPQTAKRIGKHWIPSI